LHGSAEIGENGVVTVDVSRREQILLQGILIKPDLNVMTSVQFEPLPDASHTAVGPDFSLLGREVNSVFMVMRAQGFHIDCLYNQETDEKPQLYFSHQINIGNAYVLAEAVRRGLDLTNSE
jgi:hypothetical protein